MGYVGLPMAIEFARAGFTVTGVDVDHERCEALNQGHSYIADVSDAANCKRPRRTANFIAPAT